MLKKILWFAIRKLPIEGVTEVLKARQQTKRNRHMQTMVDDEVFAFVHRQAQERKWSPSQVVYFILKDAALQASDNEYLIEEMENTSTNRTYMLHSNEKSPTAVTVEPNIQ